jgi:hypothetical protein
MKRFLLSILLLVTLTCFASIAGAACTYTTNLGLCKSPIGDGGPAWANRMNDNMDLLDAASRAPVIKGYATASLPSASAGLLARVTDGDCAGAIVVGNGSEWHTLSYYQRGEMNIACPPWNMLSDGTDNATGFQDVLDDWLADKTDPRRYILVPPGPYSIKTCPISITDADSSTLLRIVGTGPRSKLLFDCTGTRGMKITGGNKVWLQDILIGGGTDVPEILFECASCSQVEGHNVYFGPFDTAGFKGPGPWIYFDGGACGAQTSGSVSTDACFLVLGEGVQISNYYIEHNAATKASLVAISGTAGEGIDSLRVIDNTCAGYGGGALLRDESAGVAKYIRRVLVARNHCSDMEDSAVYMTSTATDLKVLDNVFEMRSGATAATALDIRNQTRATIRGNVLKDFSTAISSDGNTGTTITGNASVNTTAQCFVSKNGDAGGFWSDNSVYGRCGGGSGNVLKLTSATGGGNTYQNFRLMDANSKSDGYTVDTTGLDASDTVHLMDGTQVYDCTDTVTVNFYMDNVKLTNSTGTCALTLGTANAVEGERMRVTLASASGTPTVDGDTITTDDVFLYQYQNSAWAKLN